MLVILLTLVSSACAVDLNGLIDTGTVKWRDCSDRNPWVKVEDFNITPRPIKIPGEMNVTLEGPISHRLADSVNLKVLIERKLLSTWTTVPCKERVGTCIYDDPCEFLNTFKQQASCPAQLTANGLPCTCPFNPSQLHLPASTFTVANISEAWSFMNQGGEYHIKLSMEEKSSHLLRGCLEAYFEIDD